MAIAFYNCHDKLISNPKESRWLDEDTYYLYCGRPSELGNPYEIGKDGTREEVLNKLWKDSAWFKKATEVIDKVLKQQPNNIILGCWCFPERCHCEQIAPLIFLKDTSQQLDKPVMCNGVCLNDGTYHPKSVV